MYRNFCMGTKDNRGSSCVQSYHVIYLGSLGNPIVSIIYFRATLNITAIFGGIDATSNLADPTVWKWTEDGKLMNQKKEFSWKYGQKKWSRVNNFIVDDETGKVLDIKGSNQTVEAEVVLWSKVWIL